MFKRYFGPKELLWNEPDEYDSREEAREVIHLVRTGKIGMDVEAWRTKRGEMEGHNLGGKAYENNFFSDFL